MSDEYSDERLHQILDTVAKWGRGFSQSPYFEELTLEQNQESESIVMFFAEYMYSYLGLPPNKWDRGGVEECCVDILPRKISTEETFFESIAPVLSAFFRYIGEEGLVPNASTLAARVEKLHKQIVRAASNPANWGFAKAFIMSAIEAGVDPTDERELQRFMAAYNASLMPNLPMGLGRKLSPGTRTPKRRSSKRKRKRKKK